MIDSIDDHAALLKTIRDHVAMGRVRLTRHAHERMVEQGISLSETIEAATEADMLEHYPEHRRGPCCLLNGVTNGGRPLHLVCTTVQPMLIIITVYEPSPPKWTTTTQRKRES